MEPESRWPPIPTGHVEGVALWTSGEVSCRLALAATGAPATGRGGRGLWDIRPGGFVLVRLTVLPLDRWPGEARRSDAGYGLAVVIDAQQENPPGSLDAGDLDRPARAAHRGGGGLNRTSPAPAQHRGSVQGIRSTSTSGTRRLLLWGLRDLKRFGMAGLRGSESPVSERRRMVSPPGLMT